MNCTRSAGTRICSHCCLTALLPSLSTLHIALLCTQHSALSTLAAHWLVLPGAPSAHTHTHTHPHYSLSFHNQTPSSYLDSLSTSIPLLVPIRSKTRTSSASCVRFGCSALAMLVYRARAAVMACRALVMLLLFNVCPHTRPCLPPCMVGKNILLWWDPIASAERLSTK